MPATLPRGTTRLFDQPGGVSVLQDLWAFPGDVFFVDNALGTDDAGHGRQDGAGAFKTLDYAVGQCANHNGDVIVLAPGHAETVSAAAGIDLDVAGITVWGRGRGSKMPTITLGTLTTATVRINAANVTVHGVRFKAGTAQLLVKMLDVNADDAVIEDCEFLAATTATFLVKSGVNIATTIDGTKVKRCRFIQGTDPAGANGGADTGAIYLVDSENVEVEDCEFRGNWETGFIHNRTTGAANLWVRGCFGICALADAVPFTLVATATGGAVRCSFVTPAEAATTEATLSGTFPAGFFNFQSFFGNDGGGGQNAIASQAAAS